MRCHDRTCGALDCPSCYPTSYKDANNTGCGETETETVAAQPNGLELSHPATEAHNNQKPKATTDDSQ
jgi:hypothetical protein